MAVVKNGKFILVPLNVCLFLTKQSTGDVSFTFSQSIFLCTFRTTNVQGIIRKRNLKNIMNFSTFRISALR